MTRSLLHLVAIPWKTKVKDADIGKDDFISNM